MWDKFNPSQLEAVKAINGAIQISSVAGSGKTTVLTHRVEHMINDLGISARKILLMTFTKKAADEMKVRLKQLISKEDLEALFCGTSHSFGYRVLATEYKCLGHHLQSFCDRNRGVKAAGILQGSTQQYFAEAVRDSLLKKPLSSAVAATIESLPVQVYLRVISMCKNKDLSPAQYYERLKVDGDLSDTDLSYSIFYDEYERMKDERKSIDFDDMLYLVVCLFREHPEILAKYQEYFEYLMIDEAQDNNVLQYKLASMLVNEHGNIFIVGDDDQSMYSFRGANVDSFINFNKYYPDLVRISLENNYRSNPDILNKANMLIAQNKKRIPKQLVPHKKDDNQGVWLKCFNNEIREAAYVADQIEKICNDPDQDFTSAIAYESIAVLYRTNSQCKEVEDALIIKNIPYVIHGGFSFYDRKEVKDILSYLRLVEDHNDDEAFARVYNTPNRYLGRAFITKLRTEDKHSLWNACDHVALTQRERYAIDAFKKLIAELQRMYRSHVSINEMIDHILYRGYADHLRKNSSGDADDDIFEVVNKIKFFAKNFKSIDKLMDYVEMMAGKRKDSINGVQLMSIHRSKGLEFDTVFGVGFNEGLLPHKRSIEEYDLGSRYAIEEERRLAYVLATRPKTKLYISSTATYNGEESEVSRFVAEMKLDEDELREELIK